MQRLIVFLGHPTDSLAVVLFSLLVSSGVGSYLTSRVEVRGATDPAARPCCFSWPSSSCSGS
jgi:hypothetical protein